MPTTSICVKVSMKFVDNDETKAHKICSYDFLDIANYCAVYRKNAIARNVRCVIILKLISRFLPGVISDSWASCTIMAHQQAKTYL